MAVFLGCTSTGRVGLCFLWFYVQELPKAQPTVVLVLKRLRRRGKGLKSHPTDWHQCTLLVQYMLVNARDLHNSKITLFRGGLGQGLLYPFVARSKSDAL